MKGLKILWLVLAIISDLSIKELNLVFWISFSLFLMLSFYLANKMDKESWKTH